ncbi:hypothetical protein [Actinokineospora pegani]|uniref:hypothetical protein n=1 Tax=Actinokineospora pegani TaxID=2654637 RepID=UPI0012EAD767|nr:hypothetical protein [Actinokineospora pegani]
MSGREDKAAIREFVRRAHPDVGGDPDEFVAGLAALRSTAGGSTLDSADPRLDGPIVGVHRSRGLRAMTDRVRRWHSRRFRKPRVR